MCGAIVGGIIGALLGLQFVLSPTSATVGFLAGALVFGFCSARWGDTAWEALSGLFDKEDMT